MNPSSFLRNASKKVRPALFLAAALALPAAARSAVVVGNYGQVGIGYEGSGGTSGNAIPALTYNSSNSTSSLLIIILAYDGSALTSLSMAYNSVALTPIAGPINIAYSSNPTNFYVYAIFNPASVAGGIKPTFPTVSPADGGGFSCEYIDYNGVSAIGKTSITSTYTFSGSGSNSIASFAPLSTNSTILEYLPFADNDGCDPTAGFAVTLGSVVQQMAEFPENAVSGGAFGDYPQTTGASFTLKESTSGLSCTGLEEAVWGIELEASGASSSPTNTPTKTPAVAATNTPVATNTPIQSPTRTSVPAATNTPVVGATNTPVATATPVVTNTPVATNTPVSAATNTPVAGATPIAPVIGNYGIIENESGGTGSPVSYNSTMPSLTYSGSGSLLLVWVTMQADTTSCVTVTYGGQTMSLLSGPVIVTVPPGGCYDEYIWTYYIQNPANNQTLTMSYGDPLDGLAAQVTWWVDCGHTAATGVPIGNFLITNAASDQVLAQTALAAATSSNSIVTSAGNSTLLGFFPIADCNSQYGWNYDTTPASPTYTFACNGSGTVWASPSANDVAACSSNTSGATVVQCGEYTEAMGLGEYSPGGTAGQSYTVTQGITDTNYSDVCGYNWIIELLGSGSGNTSATPVPIGTYNCTSLPTYTPVGGVPTSTPAIPTPTPANTPLPTVYQGLPPTMRPYGLEYVPFPTVTTSSDQFYPLYAAFGHTGATGPQDSAACATCSAEEGGPVNTARWHIVFQDLSTVALATTGTVKVETRIGAENGTTCLTGVYDPALYTGTSLTLPTYPQNDSNAYFWVSTSATQSPGSGGVPYTERFDAVGDPRFMPYADEIGSSTVTDGWNSDGLVDGYNWFWRNFSSAEPSDTYVDQGQDTYYAAFIPQADNDGYTTVSTSIAGPNFDVPKLFSLIRNGTMISNAIYTAMSGYSSYYAGLGGEIGGSTANNFQRGMSVYAGPWGASSSPYYVDEVMGQYGGNTTGSTTMSVNGAAYVVTGTSGSIGWTSLPFIGELWPDILYQGDWKDTTVNTTWGNLTNVEQGGQAFRAPLASIPSSVTGGSYFRTSLHMNQAEGSASFFNGNNGSGYFGHNSTAFQASELNDAVQASTDYNLTLPSTFDSQYPWTESGGTAPPEWSQTQYSGARTHLDVYSAATYTAGGVSSPDDWGFYAAASGDSAITTDKSAAAVRAIDLNEVLSTVSGNKAGGWFIMNGLSPSSQAGIDFLTQFTLVEAVRTFHDAGVPTAAASTASGTFTNPNNTYSGAGIASDQTYRIPPVPLVTILSPSTGSQMPGITTLTLTWNLRYARWDGGLYDENYPCIDANVGPCSSSDLLPNPANEWQDPQQLAFNIIYSIPTSSTPNTWYEAGPTGSNPGEVPEGVDNNNVSGTAGIYDPNVAFFPGGSYQVTPSVTNNYAQYAVTFPTVQAANYDIRVEAFRLQSAGSTVDYANYGYDQISVNTQSTQ